MVTNAELNSKFDILNWDHEDFKKLVIEQLAQLQATLEKLVVDEASISGHGGGPLKQPQQHLMFGQQRMMDWLMWIGEPN